MLPTGVHALTPRTSEYVIDMADVIKVDGEMILDCQGEPI